jgi:hypothetical protein
MIQFLGITSTPLIFLIFLNFYFISRSAQANHCADLMAAFMAATTSGIS